MNEYEEQALYNIAETCVNSISINELLRLTGEDKSAFMEHICDKRLTYGSIHGAPVFLEGVRSLYDTLEKQDILTTHGAAGANHMAFYSLVGPGDHVIAVKPTYQQLYSIPESMGAEVDILCLKKDHHYLPDPAELHTLIKPNTKMIVINNPNNPSGALMSSGLLDEIIEIARAADAYLLCDEVYRFLTQEDGANTKSVADLYEKGISVSSMSKIFSLAGIRLGWIATRDKAAMQAFHSHRDYDTISCGIINEELAAIALRHADTLLARNRNLVRTNLRLLDEWINAEPHISYIKPQAGTTTLLHYDLPIPSYDFCLGLLKETGTLLTPGACFDEEYCARIGYACSTEELQNGLEQLSRYLDKCSLRL